MANTLVGISYPFRIGGAGLPAKAVGADAIKACLITLLKTPRRSRVMRPSLGTNLLALIFEVQSPALADLIRREIVTAVLNELPMVDIVKIDVIDDGTTVDVNVFYFIQGQYDETGEVTVATRT